MLSIATRAHFRCVNLLSFNIERSRYVSAWKKCELTWSTPIFIQRINLFSDAPDHRKKKEKKIVQKIYCDLTLFVYPSRLRLSLVKFKIDASNMSILYFL
jgi:hypothetical protein